jgi:glycosyltransferase involved in cell wall biosynthesis
MEVSGARPERVTTVYYGIETPKTEPFAREQFKIPKDAFVVGFVGRLVKQKNLNVFLEALRQQGNVLGVIVGSGPQLDELKRYVEIRQIANVRFLGPIPDAERVMPTFNLLCLPSLWEGLGLVLIEAMLRRVSIIGSRRGAIPEILGRGRYGILFDPTVDGLIQAIAFALENPSLLSAQVEEAYEYARKQFTVEAMVHNTINVYRLIEESGKGI